MVIKKETNEIIGDIGFKGYNMTDNSCDVGYGIIEAERKKGYAEEASKALISWALSNESIVRISASTCIENIGSIYLLNKLNFKEIDRDNTFIYWNLIK